MRGILRIIRAIFHAKHRQLWFPRSEHEKLEVASRAANMWKLGGGGLTRSGGNRWR